MGNKAFPVNSDVLRQLRDQKGWTQVRAGTELAKFFGIDAQRDPVRMANDYPPVLNLLRRPDASSTKMFNFGCVRKLCCWDWPMPVKYGR